MSQDLQALVLPDAYRDSRAHLFPSAQSFIWFSRRNRKRLADAGALVVIGGRYMVDPAKADEVVLAVGREAAHKKAAA